MTPRQRFHKTLHYGSPGQIPYFEEGIRADTLAVWESQGYPSGADPQSLFPADAREEIKLDLDPHPRFKVWPSTFKELDSLRERLDSADLSRISETGP